MGAIYLTLTVPDYRINLCILKGELKPSPIFLKLQSINAID